MKDQNLLAEVARRYDLNKEKSDKRFVDDLRYMNRFAKRSFVLVFKHESAHMIAAHHLGYHVKRFGVQGGGGHCRVREKVMLSTWAAVCLAPAWVSGDSQGHFAPGYSDWGGIRTKAQERAGKKLLASFGAQLRKTVDDLTASLPTETWEEDNSIDLANPWEELGCEAIYQRNFGEGRRNGKQKGADTGNTTRGGGERKRA